MAAHPDEAAFLAAIAAAPDDALPRLVFADWLEERNDPRAVWVRDADIWEWMKPDAHDPVPGILNELRLEPWVPHPGRREQPDLKAKAERGLLHLGASAIDAVRDWLRTSPDHWPSVTVQIYVATHPPSDLRSVSELMAVLEQTSGVEVWLAVVDLGFQGPAAAPAVSVLTTLIGKDLWSDLVDNCETHERPIENAVNRTLGKIGPAALKAVPWLAEHMWMYEESAAEALIQLRANPDQIVDHMNTDEDCEVEAGIHHILELADDPVAFLVHNAQRHTGRVAYCSLWLLAEMGPRASAALPALQDLHNHRTEWDAEYVREAAIRAIEAISPST
jgi:uncharacterized protein (TIGR02996 family)